VKRGGAVNNVRAIRPMRILLVTDDEGYADEVALAAALRGVDLVLVANGDDLDDATTLHLPNVVVLDAHDALARTSRTASVFAALHPRIAIVIVANRAAERGVGGIRVVDKWRSAERVLSELEHAYLGLASPAKRSRSAGE
jgi:DNA-binding response OmpR family regulator